MKNKAIDYVDIFIFLKIISKKKIRYHFLSSFPVVPLFIKLNFLSIAGNFLTRENDVIIHSFFFLYKEKFNKLR